MSSVPGAYKRFTSYEYFGNVMKGPQPSSGLVDQGAFCDGRMEALIFSYDEPDTIARAHRGIAWKKHQIIQLIRFLGNQIYYFL